MSTFLVDPLSISDLINKGASFEIKSDYDLGFTEELFEELNLGSDNEDIKEELQTDITSPWTKSFDELRVKMVKINENIWKRVTQEGNKELGLVPEKARVSIRYSGYWEGEGAPFDSSFLRGTSHSFYTSRCEVLEGLEAAVRTMYVKESAQFIISYQMLFHEMGCPPRVKPKADGLFTIEVLGFNVVGDLNATDTIAEEDRTKFSFVIDKVKDVHLKGLDFFGQKMFRNACKAFERAVDVLQYCRLANEQEQKEQTAFLIKLYTNLAVCYNKTHAPTKTCIMCKEINRLTGGKPSCKALFQEGRALFVLGDYKRARTVLTRAQSMEPSNDEINKELKSLEKRFASYQKNERELWGKAIGIIKKQEAKSEKLKNSECLNEFGKHMEELLKDFKSNLDISKINLPSGLTAQEIKILENLANRMDLSLTLSQIDKVTYTLSKQK